MKKKKGEKGRGLREKKGPLGTLEESEQVEMKKRGNMHALLAQNQFLPCPGKKKALTKKGKERGWWPDGEGGKERGRTALRGRKMHIVTVDERGGTQEEMGRLRGKEEGTTERKKGNCELPAGCRAGNRSRELGVTLGSRKGKKEDTTRAGRRTVGTNSGGGGKETRNPPPKNKEKKKKEPGGVKRQKAARSTTLRTKKGETQVPQRRKNSAPARKNKFRHR